MQQRKVSINCFCIFKDLAFDARKNNETVLCLVSTFACLASSIGLEACDPWTDLSRPKWKTHFQTPLVLTRDSSASSFCSRFDFTFKCIANKNMFLLSSLSTPYVGLTLCAQSPSTFATCLAQDQASHITQTSKVNFFM